MMVQSLGWHRLSSFKDDNEALRQQKLVIFWMLYIVDKNLCLRLGQASLFQDYDIDLPWPRANPPSSLASLGHINLWVDSARIMGLIYQQLYSPGALRQPDDVRLQAFQQLLPQIRAVKPKTSDKVRIQLGSKSAQFKMLLLTLN
jgi:hypothetical protein